MNMSIDSPNVPPDNPVTTGSFNYIDTYIEYVVEVVMKYDNAIPEPNKRHQKFFHHKLFQVICEYVRQPGNYLSVHWKEKVFLNYSDKYAYQFIKEISPPPEA